MPETNEMLDLESLQQNAENVPEEEVEAQDYTPFTATPPGRYISPSRSIKGKQREEDGHFTFEIKFEGGIVAEGDPSRVYEKGQFPLTDRRVSTKPFQDFDRGVTSGASKYLFALGISTKGLRPDAVIPLMLESQTQPVGVVVGRAPKAQKDESGQYVMPFYNAKDPSVVVVERRRPDGFREYRTKDFRDKDGNLLNTLEAGGVTWQSKAIVDGYFKIK